MLGGGSVPFSLGATSWHGDESGKYSFVICDNALGDGNGSDLGGKSIKVLWHP